MDNKLTHAEAFVYLDATFKLMPPGSEITVFQEFLLDAFETLDRASAYFSGRGGALQRIDDRRHFLRKAPNAK